MWTIETHKGVFEGDRLRSIISEMADYSVDDDSVLQILCVYWEGNIHYKELSGKKVQAVISNYEDHLELEKKHNLDEIAYRKGIQFDYYSAL